MSDHRYLVHYINENNVRLPGLQTEDGIYALSAEFDSLAPIFEHIPAEELLDTLDAHKKTLISGDPAPITLPDHVQVWAAGVTYKISEEARERESAGSTIYTRVYDAERPELFMKAAGYEVRRHGDPAGIRYDASWSVPEPELAIVLNNRMEVIGFTIGNDMSSRDIEGANPLYLPQAKVYDGACVLGPRIWLTPNLTEWPDVEIDITIKRDDAAVFNGKTTTANIHRTLADLVEHLGRCKHFPYGAVLLTGTGVVPPDEFTLEEGDVVSIRIDPIGELVNPVEVVRAAHR